MTATARKPPPDHVRNAYAFNPGCRCSWCLNGGTPTKGYMTTVLCGPDKGKRRYQVNDSTASPHIPISRSPFDGGSPFIDQEPRT